MKMIKGFHAAFTDGFRVVDFSNIQEAPQFATVVIENALKRELMEEMTRSWTWLSASKTHPSRKEIRAHGNRKKSTKNYITQLKEDIKEETKWINSKSISARRKNIDLLNDSSYQLSFPKRRDVSAYPLFVTHPDPHSSILVIVVTKETVTPIDTIAFTNCGPFTQNEE